MNRILYLLMLLIGTPALAQAQTFDNLMRSSGRIYVVIAVLLIIFVGIILYIVRIDRKISKLKKDNS